MAIALGSRSFDSPQDVKHYIERLLDQAELGELISDDVVLALLRLHPRWLQLSSGMTAVAAAIVGGQKDVAICFGEDDVAAIDWRAMLDCV
jgi:hypothetical protein